MEGLYFVKEHFDIIFQFYKDKKVRETFMEF